MAQLTSMGQKIRSLALFVARVNESERARNEKMAISRAFTLVTNKAKVWIFYPCWSAGPLARPLHRIGPRDNNLSLLETGKDKRLIS